MSRWKRNKKLVRDDLQIELAALRPLAVNRMRTIGIVAADSLDGHGVARRIVALAGPIPKRFTRKKAVAALRFFIQNPNLSAFAKAFPSVAESSLKPRGKSRKEIYKEYIQSEEWKIFRENVLRKRGESCEECMAANVTLHLHHLTYKRLGHERESDVKILCIPCHQKKHPNKKLERR